MSSTSLVVVGFGIKFLSHLTCEAKAHIEQSDKVLYLVNEPAAKIWIQRVNNNSESLDDIYNSCDLRQQSYDAITEYILKSLRNNQHVCVVLYGHPTVFAQPALNAVIQARREGFAAKILPGISSEDCLFADLMIDPGTHGALSLEATDLLVCKRHIDVTCHVILWQVSVIGMLGHAKSYNNKKGVDLLYKYLCQYYPLDHELISYEAAQYPGLEPRIVRIKLNQLNSIEFTRISTLYIPPLIRPIRHESVLVELCMSDLVGGVGKLEGDI